MCGIHCDNATCDDLTVRRRREKTHGIRHPYGTSKAQKKESFPTVCRNGNDMPKVSHQLKRKEHLKRQRHRRAVGEINVKSGIE